MSIRQTSAIGHRHRNLVHAASFAVGALIALGVGLVILSSARTTQHAVTQRHPGPCTSGCLRATFGSATSSKPPPEHAATSPAHSTPRFLVDPGTGFAVEQRQPAHAVRTGQLYRVNRGPGFVVAAPH
jgi:hypothetical protein